MMGCQKLLSSDLKGQEFLTSLSGHKIKITVNEVIPFAVPLVRMSLFLSFEGTVVVASGLPGPTDTPRAVLWQCRPQQVPSLAE